MANEIDITANRTGNAKRRMVIEFSSEPAQPEEKWGDPPKIAVSERDRHGNYNPFPRAVCSPEHIASISLTFCENAVGRTAWIPLIVARVGGHAYPVVGPPPNCTMAFDS